MLGAELLCDGAEAALVADGAERLERGSDDLLGIAVQRFEQRAHTRLHPARFRQTPEQIDAHRTLVGRSGARARDQRVDRGFTEHRERFFGLACNAVVEQSIRRDFRRLAAAERAAHHQRLPALLDFVASGRHFEQSRARRSIERRERAARRNQRARRGSHEVDQRQQSRPKHRAPAAGERLDQGGSGFFVRAASSGEQRRAFQNRIVQKRRQPVPTQHDFELIQPVERGEREEAIALIQTTFEHGHRRLETHCPERSDTLDRTAAHVRIGIRQEPAQV